VKATLAIVLMLVLPACESRPRGPVPLERDDACASCRMLISERRYAAELIDNPGEVYRFDDIACMLRFAHAHGISQSGARFYVTDYASGNSWIDAGQAHFVGLKSSASSPMASGIVAFRDSGSAARASGQKEGSITFDELWAKDIAATSTGAALEPSRK
jgi:copper chaperone NosL